MQQHLQAIVTVLSLVNPLICGAIFAQSKPVRPVRHGWPTPPSECADLGIGKTLRRPIGIFAGSVVMQYEHLET